MSQTAIRLRNVHKSFGPVAAVTGVDLEIGDGEFFSLLGPSGSGKTTMLRLIAGFEAPTAGAVELAGQDVTGLAPFERDVNTVFQDYALFPHMTVDQNVGYGLKVRKVPRAERERRVRQALASVRLEGYGRRRPAQLSGGQRQRVALARALVNRPRVLLLDEPLGALDLQLRSRMQVELKQLQREVGITFVLVTHDQGEALSMSDRIAVVNEGRIEQVGTPAEVYERPATAFVAGFVGVSNLIEGEAAERITGAPGTYSVRPEKIRLLDAAAPFEESEHWAALGTVAEVVYVGEATRFVADLDAGGRLTAIRQNLGADPDGAGAARGSRVRLVWHRRHTVALPALPAGAGAPAPGPATATTTEKETSCA